MKDKIPVEVLDDIFPRKFKKPKASQEVYKQIKRMILSGKLKAGERLVQEELAKSFDVSRTVILMVFSQLKRDRLIVRKHKKGTFVSLP